MDLHAGSRRPTLKYLGLLGATAISRIVPLLALSPSNGSMRMENLKMFRAPTKYRLCSGRARSIARNCCFGTLLLLATGGLGFAQSNVVVVRPKEIHDVLVNPGMGITTFQRFNGQEPNPPLKWSEVGPVAKLPQAPTKPDFPDTSISYAVFCLKKKKTEPGKSHWETGDLALQAARAH